MSTRFKINLGIEELDSETTVVEDTPVVAEVETPEKEKTFSEEVPMFPEKEETAATEELEEASNLIDDASLSDINDDIVENTRDTEEVNSAADNIITLEAIAKELNNSLANGGLTPASAKLTNCALESIYKQVGIVSKKKLTVGIESFDTAENCIANTKVTIESIESKIVGIFKAIVSAIARSIEWIQKFIRQIFNKFEVHKDAIKDLRVALTKTTKDDAGDKLFEIATVVNALRVKDRPDISSNISAFSDFIKGYFAHVSDEGNALVRNIMVIAKAIPDKNVEAAIAKLIDVKPCAGMTVGTIKGTAPKSDKLVSYTSTHIFPGNAQMLAFLPKHGLNSSDWDDAAKNSEFVIHFPESNNQEGATLPILSKPDLIKLLHSLEQICNEGTNSKKEFDIFVKDKNEMVKDMQLAITAYTNSDSEADKGGYIKTVTSRMRLLDNVYINGSVAVTKHITKTLAAGVSYSSGCVEAYA